MTSRRPLASLALVPCLLLAFAVCASCVPAPFFGFGNFGFNPSSAANSTSALGLFALAHLQHKLDALQQLSELFGVVGPNGTFVR